MKVLLVEDDVIIREQMAKILRRRFREVVEAENGQIGLETFKTFEPDIVVTDIQMPVMTGLDMTKNIREFNTTTPIIAVTAFSEESYLKRADEVGISFYLKKPLDSKLLIDKIHELAGHKIHR